jgi:pimeloyl-ACP methyl ester carboxylesterase
MIRSGDYVKAPWRYERIEDATHWMQLDQPEMINRLLINFLS